MITKDNPSMSSAAESIYLSNADVSILEQCRAREDAIAHEVYQKELIADLKQELSEANKQLDEANERNEETSKLLDEANKTIAELQKKLKELEAGKQ